MLFSLSLGWSHWEINPPNPDSVHTTHRCPTELYKTTSTANGGWRGGGGCTAVTFSRWSDLMKTWSAWSELKSHNAALSFTFGSVLLEEGNETEAVWCLRAAEAGQKWPDWTVRAHLPRSLGSIFNSWRGCDQSVIVISLTLCYGAP